MLPEDVQTTLDLIGLRPVLLEDLDEAAVLVPGFNLVLIDADLEGRELRLTIDRILELAAQELADQLREHGGQPSAG